MKKRIVGVFKNLKMELKFSNTQKMVIAEQILALKSNLDYNYNLKCKRMLIHKNIKLNALKRLKMEFAFQQKCKETENNVLNSNFEIKM